MPEYGWTNEKTKHWPDVEHTKDFPKFYLDHLQNGDDNEKQEAAWKLFQATHGNNTLARELKEYPGGLDIYAAYQKESAEKGWNTGGMVLMIGNLLHMFGHPDYKDGYMVRKGEGLGTFDYFNTLPYEGPPPLYQDDKPSVYNPKMDPLRALAGEWE